MSARPFAATSAVVVTIQALGSIRTRALAVLLAELGSGVELETWAVLVIQLLPLPETEVVIVNDPVPLCASDESSQRTVRIELAYVQPGAEMNDTREGSVSVTTTSCAALGPWLLTLRLQSTFEPLIALVFTRAKSARCGGGTAEIVTGELVDDWFCTSVSRSLALYVRGSEYVCAGRTAVESSNAPSPSRSQA